jgi:hypothetical protein
MRVCRLKYSRHDKGLLVVNNTKTRGKELHFTVVVDLRLISLTFSYLICNRLGAMNCESAANKIKLQCSMQLNSFACAPIAEAIKFSYVTYFG